MDLIWDPEHDFYRLFDTEIASNVVKYDTRMEDVCQNLKPEQQEALVQEFRYCIDTDDNDGRYFYLVDANMGQKLFELKQEMDIPEAEFPFEVEFSDSERRITLYGENQVSTYEACERSYHEVRVEYTFYTQKTYAAVKAQYLGN